MSKASRYLLALPLALCLVFSSYNGLVEGYSATHFADTPGMKVTTAVQLAYRLLGAVGLYVMVKRPSWSSLALLGWCVAVIAEGALAPVVYAGKSVLFGVGVGAVVGMLAAAACWGWSRSALSPRSGPSAAYQTLGAGRALSGSAAQAQVVR